MALYKIPQNSGKFTVVSARGGHFCVWNRKIGRHEVIIPVRSRKQAEEICQKLNRKDHDGTIEVLQ
jgi:hypothetical protein